MNILLLSSPYISLIGEDSEKTRIYYDVAELAGGDMGVRCAVRIVNTAHNLRQRILRSRIHINILEMAVRVMSQQMH